MSQHTPGPWNAGYYLENWAVAPDTDPSHPVARMCNFVTGEANARLIAAAPTMYQFLIKVANLHNNPWMAKEAIEILRQIDASIEIQS